VLWHRAQRCNPGLAHPSLAHVGLESYNQCFRRLHGGAIGASDGGSGEGALRCEGCKRKSQPTSEVFRRGLIGVMNEGLEWARLPRVAAWWLHGGHILNMHTAACAIGESGCAFRMGETRRRIGGAG
jgi:hypothetical protein